MNIQEQKEQLLAKKEQLEKELSTLGQRIPGRDDWMVRPDEGDGVTADPIDNADITEDFEEKIAVLKVLERQYSQIADALLAIENNSYGTCIVCGESIPEKRLLADPSALTCIEHA